MKVHQFQARVGDVNASALIIFMQNSLWVWMGAEGRLDALAMAMPSRFESTPIGTALVGEISDPTSKSIAQRLAKKTGCQCFVSCNFDSSDPLIAAAMEKKVLEEILKDGSVATSLAALRV
eukprot:m.150401 g.150401  ORF g.150401 m.150401 type:complete len:121 (+) comp15082_c1_seq2:72-434(+)